MKVAVSAYGPTLDDPVDERFGRATYLVVVDTETFAAEPIDNRANCNALQGAGPGTAEAVARAGAAAVITGHLGPKAYDALALADIGGYRAAGGMQVREAVHAFAEGHLHPLSKDTSHAGLG